MSQEIERKFLVTGDFRKEAKKAVRISQGFLSSVPERIVRVRVNESNGFITVKGAANETGVSRYEWEKEIPLNEAEELLKLCEPGIIDKTRFIVEAGKHVFEIDEFLGDNHGLIVAEIELSDEAEEFFKPNWLGKEVTGDAKYYNSSLSKTPFKDW